MHLTTLLPAATGTGTSGLQLALLALPLIALVWVLVMSRRRQRAVDERMAAIRVGDQVVTASGMLGRVVALADDVARLEVAPGVVVEFDRRAVVSTVEQTPGLGDTAGTGAPTKEQ